MDEQKQSHRYTDDDILKTVISAETATTSAVADELGCTRPAADYRLRKLRNERTSRRHDDWEYFDLVCLGMRLDDARFGEFQDADKIRFNSEDTL